VFRWAFARQVLLLLWAASVAVCTLVLVVSFHLTPEALDLGALGWAGACPVKLAGGACSLCGMSHSFAAMAAGRWHAAGAFHAWGPFLFVLFLLNCACGTGVLVHAFRRRTGLQHRGRQWA